MRKCLHSDQASQEYVRFNILKGMYRLQDNKNVELPSVDRSVAPTCQVCGKMIKGEVKAGRAFQEHLKLVEVEYIYFSMWILPF